MGSKKQKEKMFYNSSMPRCGSELMQNILAQNPDFYSSPTSGLLELVYSARGAYSNSQEFKAQDPEMMSKAFAKFCKSGMKGYYSEVTDKPYIIDKSRGWGIHFDFLNFVHGEKPKIICMVRDIRAIYASMEKNFRKDPTDAGIVNWQTGQCTTVAKRVEYWSQNVPINIALERLKEMFNTGIAKDILFIKFEDLTENPKAIMKELYEKLEVPNFEHDFSNIKQSTEEAPNAYGTFGDHNIRPEVKPVKKDWNQVLGKELSKAIYDNHKWYNEIFKYK